MELSEPAIDHPRARAYPCATGKRSRTIRFRHINREVSDKGSSSPRLIIPSPGRGPAPSCGCSSGSPVAPLTKVSVV